MNVFFAFLRFFPFTDCEGAIQLDVVSSTFSRTGKQVHNVLQLDETEWLTKGKSTGDQGFVLRIRGCKRTITGIRIQNAAKPSATKTFRVMGASEINGDWNNLLEADLEENSEFATFHMIQPVELRFVRFELLSSHRGEVAGLQSFSLTTGKSCYDQNFAK